WNPDMTKEQYDATVEDIKQGQDSAAFKLESDLGYIITHEYKHKVIEKESEGITKLKITKASQET
ncbi:MAG: hypothetical protein Q9212_006427, partial [Teloschistes hypoglaucus]